MIAVTRHLVWLVAGSLLFALCAPSEAAYRRNQFGPTGAMCRAACGPDCPATCEKLRYAECVGGGFVRRVERFTCGTHQGCRDHDYCLDNCAAQGVSQEGIDFVLAECNRECHMLAHAWAMEQFGTVAGTQYVNSWRRGHGPYTGQMTWEYTKDSPDAQENIRPCPACTKCEGGACVPLDTDECEPCQTCGDVHVRTLDGLRFDFQSSGDFILVESPDGVRIEARQLPYVSGVSVNTAMAARVDGRLIRVALQPSRRVQVDGREFTSPPDETISLDGGGTLSWEGDTVVLRSNDGWLVVTRMFRSFLNVSVRPPDAMRGRLTGLLGDGDGDPGNDLRSRDGAAYAIDLSFDELYDGFGGSWREHPDHSLLAGLPWPDNVPKDGSGRPPVIATLENLDPMLRWQSEDVCRAAGLGGSANFDACVLDFAMTGDDEMLDSAIVSAEGVVDARIRDRSRRSDILATGEVVLEGPARATAGSHIVVRVLGDVAPEDLLALVPVDSVEDGPGANTSRVGEGGEVVLLVPPEPGDYRLAYLRYPGRELAVQNTFEVLPLEVTLMAPAQVPAGSPVLVEVDGEGRHTDLLVIAMQDAPQDSLGRHFSRRGRDRAVELKAPSVPGVYELRYLIDQRRHMVARLPLVVTPLQVYIDAPETAAAGGTLDVRLEGEFIPRGRLVVVAEGEPDHAAERSGRVSSHAEVVTLRNLPETPGRYEIRFVIEPGTVVIARRPLQIEAESQ